VWLSKVAQFGLVWLAIGAVAAVVLRRPRVFVTLLVADAVAELAADVLKAALPRHRPRVHQLGGRLTEHSFPSGHTTTSFACATVLAAFVPRLRVPFYVLAVLVAVSRLYNGVHYPTDVIAGAALGTAVGATALLLLSGRRRRSPRARRRG
jgi:undecaprenyl-diphosphatase